ncbi:BolA family transcriptional regulator [Pseudothauera nasutitermitis]|uniref:BolA family transcriptional regulator n=1 Tax=Pseudothauera nasutitermitis TaxID=2565930 RepID=A0A4S4B560_9RHOO|nr:BolA family protein [Pseudothauera nasutitermitis]THF66107.1 BolA family transcriptional regulator [Pseudothauera nasutitermitis]
MDALLRAAFQPEYIAIRDDSALHAGHAGARSGGGHYHLEIVSASFEGKNSVLRHRMIHQALGSMMQSEIHALSIRARTAEEAANQPTPKEIR